MSYRILYLAAAGLAGVLTLHGGGLASSHVRRRVESAEAAPKVARRAAHRSRVATYSPPVVSFPSTYNSDNRDVSHCAADCFENVVTYAPPSYVSASEERAVTLVYRSGSADPRGTVSVEARDDSPTHPTKMSISVMRPDGSWETQINNDYEMVFTYPAAGGTVRLTAQFKTWRPSGAYARIAVVRSFFADGTVLETQVPVRVLVVNERYSPYGAGWSIAGVQHLAAQDGDSLAITDGAGSIAFFVPTPSCSPSACVYTPPAGDFSTVTHNTAAGDSAQWVRAYPDGARVGFDAGGFMRWSEDRFGNHTRIYWASQGVVQRILDPTGHSYFLDYDADQKLSAIREGVPQQIFRTTQVNVTAGKLTDVYDPAGAHALQAAYDTAYHLTALHDRRTTSATNYTEFGYDHAGKLGGIALPTVTADGAQIRPVVGLWSQERTLLPDPASPNNGTREHPGNTVPTDFYAYVTDPRGNSVYYRLDRFGAPVTIEDAVGHFTRVDYDAHGRPTRTVEPSGHEVHYAYTGPDLTQVTDLTTSAQINYAYDSRYHLLTHVSGSTAEVVYSPSADARAITSTQVGGAQAWTRYEVDARGRPSKVTDPEGHVTTYTYDPLNFQNLVSTTAPGSRTTTLAYDSTGLVHKVTDPAGDTAVTIRDALNRVRQEVGPRNDVTTYVYGDSLYLTSVTDAKGQLYQFAHNALGWVDYRVDPRGQFEYFGYDRNGNVTSYINRRSQQVTFTYDALNRPLTRTQVAEGQTTTFRYDNVHDAWQIDSTAESRDSVAFDATGRVTAEAAARGGALMVVSSTYTDPVGLRTSVAWSGGPVTNPHVVRYHYNAALQLDSLTDLTGQATGIGYNTDHLPTGVVYPSALTQTETFTSVHRGSQRAYGGPSAGDVNLAFAHSARQDALGRWAERFSSQNDTSRRYTYDPAGQLTHFSKQALGEGSCSLETNYGRNCTGQHETTIGLPIDYPFDLVGNPNDASATVEAGNRLTTLNGYSLAYDNDGNLVRKVKSGVANDSLVWNSLGQLTSVLRGGAVVAEFGYDGLGRRVRKTTSGVTTRYLYDGDNAVMEADVNWNPLAEYAFYPGVDSPHSVTAGQQTLYFIGEGAGNIQGLVNSIGNAVTTRYEYGPWGEVERNDTTVRNSLRFQSRPYDAETGLYDFRARYYDPQLRRFISEDPIGLDAGINPYIFTGNDPINNTDPFGLDACIQWTTPIWEVTSLEDVETGRRLIGEWVDYTGDCSHGGVDQGPGGGGRGGGPAQSCQGPANVSAFVRAHRDDAAILSAQLAVPGAYLLGLSGVESGWGSGASAVEGNNFFSIHDLGSV